MDEIDELLRRNAEIQQAMKDAIARGEALLAGRAAIYAQYGHTPESFKRSILSSLPPSKRESVIRQAEEEMRRVECEVADTVRQGSPAMRRTIRRPLSKFV